MAAAAQPNEVEACAVESVRLESRSVHRAHLEACMSLPSYAVAAWSLDSWCHSPIGRWPKYAHRWTRRLVQDAHGVSRATATRAKVELRKLWVEVEPGDWMPRRDAWPEPEGQWYFLSGALRARLRVVGAELGHAAWRLALHLMIRCRAAVAAGRETLVVPNRTTGAALGMSAATVQRAIHGLAQLGLVRIVGRGMRYPSRGELRRPARRLHAFCLLSAETVHPELDSGSEALHTCSEAQSRSMGAQLESTPKGSSRFEQQQGGALAPLAVVEGEGAPAAPAVDSMVRAALEVLSVLGVGDTPSGRDLARLAQTADGARSWLETERPALEASSNPAGWLVWASRNGSEPGKPSERARRLGRARGLSWSERGVWLTTEPVASVVTERLCEPPSEPSVTDWADAVAEVAAEAGSHVRSGDLEAARIAVKRARELWRWLVGYVGCDGDMPELAVAARALSQASAEVAAAWRERSRRVAASKVQPATAETVSSPALRDALGRLRAKWETKHGRAGQR